MAHGRRGDFKPIARVVPVPTSAVMSYASVHTMQNGKKKNQNADKYFLSGCGHMWGQDQVSFYKLQKEFKR